VAYGDQGVAPTPENLPHDQLSKIIPGDQKWTDDYAKRVVRSDFAYAEAYRTHAHDWRYRNASELYLAWAGQRYWDGTRVPRSSLGIFVVFEQVESMLPKIVDAICDPESYNFYATRSDQEDHALAWRRLVEEQLGEVDYREHIRRAVKSSLVYGNGICETGFEDYYNEVVEFDRSHTVSQMGMMYHPLVGQIPVPQKIDTRYTRKVTNKKKSRPYLRYVSVIDFYVDPNCESQQLQKAGYVIKRQYLRAEEIKELAKGNKDFKLPSDKELTEMSHAKTTANQDVTKLSSELFRYNMWNPAMDYSSDPGQKRIECIEYTNEARKVWMLNRDWIFYNKLNRYGKINYWSFHYADVLDRWHALSISDVAEGEQRLQQSITNARIDELALSIHRPMVKRRGVTIPAYQLKVRPGVVIETEVPEGDIKQLEVQNITQQAYIEVQASESRVQRITGVTDLAAMGTPSSGGNAAARTATGVNTQAGATQDRMKYYISNAESLFIEPVLNEWIALDKKFLDMHEAALWLMSDPDFQGLDPLDVMNCDVKAECRASIRMGARMGFLQIFPQLSQVFLNPEMLQLAAQQHKKAFNVEEWTHMAMDAISYAPRNPLWIEMTKEMQQAMNQPPPAEKAKALIAAQQIQSDTQKHQEQNKTKLLMQLMKSAFQHSGEMAALDDKHLQFLIEQAVKAQTAHDQNQLTESANQQAASEGTDE